MFSFFSNVPSLLKPSSQPTDKDKQINLGSVHIHDVETSDDKSSQTLKHLIKLNHINYSILFHDNQFHNHLPHVRQARILAFSIDTLLIVALRYLVLHFWSGRIRKNSTKYMLKIRLPMSPGRTRRGKSQLTIGENFAAMQGHNHSMVMTDQQRK